MALFLPPNAVPEGVRAAERSRWGTVPGPLNRGELPEPLSRRCDVTVGGEWATRRTAWTTDLQPHARSSLVACG
jgi:hypothetical protein